MIKYQKIGYDDQVNVVLPAYGMSMMVFHALLITGHPDFNLKKIPVGCGSHQAKELYQEGEIATSWINVFQEDFIDLFVINKPEE